MKEPKEVFEREFLAPARRAFRRVARKLRAENARLGLPLVVGVGSRVEYVPVTPARRSSKRKASPNAFSK
jgi:hypothetical protein